MTELNGEVFPKWYSENFERRKKDTSKVKSAQSFSLVLKPAAGWTHSLWGCASIKRKETQGTEIHGSQPTFTGAHIFLKSLYSLSECVGYWSKMLLKIHILKHWLLHFYPLRFALLVLPSVVCGPWRMAWHGTVWQIHGKAGVEVIALRSHLPL